MEGKTGLVRGWDPHYQRWRIKMDDDGKTKAIHEVNLLPVVEPVVDHSTHYVLPLSNDVRTVAHDPESGRTASQ